MHDRCSLPLDQVAPQAPAGLCVAEVPGRGRGVRAARRFAAGEVLERAPVIVVPRAELRPLRGTVLDDYWFWWDDEHNACALGWASLYNHGCPANARFALEHGARLIVFTAWRDIEAGAEVTINYHGEPEDPAPVWFVPHGAPA
jgi:SET domain-containing protein